MCLRYVNKSQGILKGQYSVKKEAHKALITTHSKSLRTFMSECELGKNRKKGAERHTIT